MKKSLLVAPALGVLLLAAAGSVGGTVAWFTSTSSVEAAAGTFQAKALEGNLAIKAVADTTKGTQQGAKDDTAQVAAANYTAVHMTANDFLTHASYDLNTGNLYTRSSEGKGGIRRVYTVGGENQTYVAKANYDGTGEGKEHDIYWAVSWTLEFSYSFATEKAANLYFDPTSTILRDSSQNPTGENPETHRKTFEGFRIAFIGETNGTGSVTTTGNVVASTTRVWAPYRTLAADVQDESEQATYIKNEVWSGTPANNYYATGTPYESAELIDSTFNAESKRPEGAVMPASGYTTDSGKADFLGKFVPLAEGVSKIKITCVAWFEGTDSEVQDADNLAMDTVSASLKFYAREQEVTA